ncbi:protein ralf-like 9 [Fagus crenata]
MAMHKALVISMATLLFCSVFLIEAANSEAIQGAPISKGGPSCSGSSCLPPPSNPYNRGCSRITRCRGGGEGPPAEGKK